MNEAGRTAIPTQLTGRASSYLRTASCMGERSFRGASSAIVKRRYEHVKNCRNGEERDPSALQKRRGSQSIARAKARCFVLSRRTAREERTEGRFDKYSLHMRGIRCQSIFRLGNGTHSMSITIARVHRIARKHGHRVRTSHAQHQRGRGRSPCLL